MIDLPFKLTGLRNLLRRTPVHPQWLLAVRNGMTPAVKNIEPGRILDIGCADRWVQGLIPSGCEYIGVDYTVTGQRLYGAQPNIFATASQLPLLDGSIDIVLIFEVVEHLRQPRAALSEIARVLRPQGRLLLTVPFLYPIHDAPHDYQRYTLHGLTREVEAVGLRVDTVQASLGSIETAGLLMCLALGGSVLKSIQCRSLSVVLIPLILIAIPVINLTAWLGGKLLPSWDAFTVGYQLTASKP